MSARARLRFALLAASAALFAVARPASSEEERPAGPSPVEAARRFADAFRANDAAAMRSAAEDPSLDPHHVADWFLASHGNAVAAEPPRPSDFLAAGAAYAERVRSRPDGRALSHLVSAW